MSNFTHLDRRSLLKSLLFLSGAAAFPGNLYAAMPDALTGLPLPLRRAGEMDIHHIDTGRGNSTLVVAPDGTTIMIDAGASGSAVATSSEPRPNATLRPGEWQARFARRHAAASHLDYFVATHIHPDHVGDIGDGSPLSAGKTFRLTGVSDVDQLLPITTVIDRAYPNYRAAPAPDAPFASNYIAYLKDRTEAGRTVLSAAVGSTRQIQANHPTVHPAFAVRILAANARVWNPHRNQTGPHSARRVAAFNEPPAENALSVALRFTYGRFSYFTGGDLNCDTHDGRAPQLDIESPVARAAGRTEVAAANHHGYFDACGPNFVRSLDAQAYIIQAWDIGHPGTAQLQRMLDAWSSDKATRDVFATDLLPTNQLMNRRFASQLKGRRGHVVVRVARGGDNYQIFVLDSSDESGNIKATFGPYLCRT